MKHISTFILTLFCISSLSALADCSPVNVTYLNNSNGLSPMTSTGIWTYDSHGYAKARQQGGGIGYLLTPVLDLAGAESVTLTFNHVHNYMTDFTSEMTLWVTDNYQGSVAASTWIELTITPYAANDKTWNFVSVSINVPVSLVGANTVFAWKYVSTASNNGTWEVKNIKITSTCPAVVGPVAPPVPLPEVGNGRLKVCAQNLRNYYFNYADNDRPDYNTPEGFAEKTHKIVNAMHMLDADIYAFCEVEAMPVVLQQLADSMNAGMEGAPFTYVTDNISVPSSTRTNNIKSGFIYRSDKVVPYGNNTPAASGMYYQETMRMQTFEELATGARFTLSMNHFKAKDSSDDQGNSTRELNANNLVSALQGNHNDPDILIMGDLNCTYGESPLNIIINASYEEQLLKYDSSAYSHCWNWEGELIDHVFANTTMASQITGAGVFHISTACESAASDNYNYRYSDHDPYLVAINLDTTSTVSGECEDIDESYLPQNASGLGEMSAVKISGTWNWRYQAAYGATCQSKGGEAWLLTPVYNMADHHNTKLVFEQALNYANLNDVQSQQTLWITDDYKGSVDASTWKQVVLPNYPSGTSWTFVSTTVNIPDSLLGANTVFGFKYAVPENAVNSPTWEIKNLHVTSSCEEVFSALPMVPQNTNTARKEIRNGQLFLVMPDGTSYTVLGIRKDN